MTKSMTTVPSGKRRRGAPNGNVNALKHGFYSKAFTQDERSDLLHRVVGLLRQSQEDDVDEDPYDLTDELFMLKVIIRNAVTRKNEGTLAETAALVRSIAAAVNAMSRINQVRFNILGPEPGKLERALQVALDNIRADIGAEEGQQEFDSKEDQDFDPDEDSEFDGEEEQEW